jgi:hypothetical protein
MRERGRCPPWIDYYCVDFNGKIGFYNSCVLVVFPLVNFVTARSIVTTRSGSLVYSISLYDFAPSERTSHPASSLFFFLRAGVVSPWRSSSDFPSSSVALQSSRIFRLYVEVFRLPGLVCSSLLRSRLAQLQERSVFCSLSTGARLGFPSPHFLSVRVLSTAADLYPSHCLSSAARTRSEPPCSFGVCHLRFFKTRGSILVRFLLCVLVCIVVGTLPSITL